MSAPSEKLEEARKDPHWASTKGVYADFSKGLDKPEFYAKCPRCGHVHGMYGSAYEAALKRYCPLCDFTRIEKLKKQVAKAARYEESAASLTDRLLEDDSVGNADEAGADEGPENTEDEIKRAVSQAIGGNWIVLAKLELERLEGLSLESEPFDALVDDDDASFRLETGSYNYTVYKDQDVAEAAAVKQVAQDLESDPDLFNRDWIEGHIDLEVLKEYFKPEEDEPEHESWDEDQWIEELVSGGYLSERPRYSGKAIEAAKKGWLEDHPPQDQGDFDVMEYLHDIYGVDKALEVALKACPRALNTAAAAQDAVDTDGIAHFLSTYDHNQIDLPSGAVAFRNG